jgi:hypothetical protein
MRWASSTSFVVAQQLATLGILAPGRVVLGVGSGEAVNEVPAGKATTSCLNCAVNREERCSARG